MWEWFQNEGLRTFCHLRDERSFDFGGELHSLICHRCSGIYSGFLIIFILSKVIGYKGYFGKPIKSNIILLLGCAFLSLSGLQVLLQKVSENPFLTGGSARFIIGFLTGMGLLHLYYAMDDRPKKEGPSYKKGIPLFLLGLAAHAFLSHQSYHWVSFASLSGLVFVYILMNHLVIESFFPKVARFGKIALVFGFIALEWFFLFWNNILRHRHD